ncbi:MAG: hypothetical protein IJK71_04830 [Clostridia bacterium]|nr:hypothetical protein [Clostridia bacterium]
MKRIGRIFCLIALVCLCISFLLSSALGEAVEFYYQAQSSYKITVPFSETEQFPFFVDVPITIIYAGEDKYSDLLYAKSDYTIGNDVILHGENIEMLTGNKIQVSQQKLSDYNLDDHYYDVLTAKYCEQELHNVDKKTLHDNKNKIRQWISSYADKSYILMIDMYIYKGVTEDIRIDSMDLPELNISLRFDDMAIETMDIPNDVIVDNMESVIDFTSANGILKCNTICKSGFTFIDGDAIVGLKQICMESANDVSVVVNADNYAEYAELLGNEGYEEQKKTNIQPGESFSLCFEYILSEKEEELYDKDSILMSYIVKAVDDKGQEHWTFGYNAYMLDPAYLIYRVMPK